MSMSTRLSKARIFKCALEQLESRSHFSVAGEIDREFVNEGALYDFANGRGRTIGMIPVAEGKLLFAGDYKGNFQLVRFKDTGKPDTSFGSTARRIFDLGGSESAVSVMRTGKKLLLAGVGGPQGKSVLLRIHLDGRLDKSFGENGVQFFDYQASLVGVDDLGRIKLSGDDGKIHSLQSDG